MGYIPSSTSNNSSTYSSHSSTASSTSAMRNLTKQKSTNVLRAMAAGNSVAATLKSATKSVGAKTLHRRASSAKLGKAGEEPPPLPKKAVFKP